MARLGLEREVVDRNIYERTVRRFREARITLPTFAQLADPTRIPEPIRRALADIDPGVPHPLNLFRVHWYNEGRELVPVPAHLVLNFDRVSEVPLTLRDEITKHGWEIAGDDAYPWLVALDRDLALIGLDQPVGQPQQRGLARAGTADNGQKLALGDVKRDVVDRHHAATVKRLADMGIGDQGRGHSIRARCCAYPPGEGKAGGQRINYHVVAPR